MSDRSRVVIEVLDELAGLERLEDRTLDDALRLARSLGDGRRVTLSIDVGEPGRSPAELRLAGTGRDVREGFVSLCAALLLLELPSAQVCIGADVLEATARGDDLELRVNDRDGAAVVRRDRLLVEWCSALSSLLGEGVMRLNDRPRAAQLFSLEWAIPALLYGSGTAWYAGRIELGAVFPSDPAPKTAPDAPLSVLLEEVLGHGPIVPAADEARARQTADAYWIGGAAPRADQRPQQRLASWLTSAPPGSHLWMLDGDRLWVVRTRENGPSIFIDTWLHTVPTLGSRALMKERLQRFHALSQSFGGSFVVDHGELRAARA